MMLSKGLIATAMLAASVSAAAACDDYAEEMAMIAAKRAVAEAGVTAEREKPAQDERTALHAGDAARSEQAPTVASAADSIRR